jgi:hypothetical protein
MGLTAICLGLLQPSSKMASKAKAACIFFMP